MFHNGCVAPKFFQLIKFPGFGQHHMNHYVYKIYQNPLFCLPSFVFKRPFIAIFFYIFLNIICNGPKLVIVACLANNKKIRHRFGYLAKVEADDIFAFFFLDGVDDCLEIFLNFI